MPHQQGYPSANFGQSTMPFPGQDATAPPPYQQHEQQQQQYPSKAGGESKDYAAGQNNSPYPNDSKSYSAGQSNSSYPTYDPASANNTQQPAEGDRGLGSMLGGFMKPQQGYGQSSSNNNNSGKSALGGAVAGALLT